MARTLEPFEQRPDRVGMVGNQLGCEPPRVTQTSIGASVREDRREPLVDRFAACLWQIADDVPTFMQRAFLHESLRSEHLRHALEPSSTARMPCSCRSPRSTGSARRSLTQRSRRQRGHARGTCHRDGPTKVVPLAQRIRHRGSSRLAQRMFQRVGCRTRRLCHRGLCR